MVATVKAWHRPDSLVLLVNTWGGGINSERVLPNFDFFDVVGRAFVVQVRVEGILDRIILLFRRVVSANQAYIVEFCLDAILASLSFTGVKLNTRCRRLWSTTNPQPNSRFSAWQL